MSALDLGPIKDHLLGASVDYERAAAILETDAPAMVLEIETLRAALAEVLDEVKFRRGGHDGEIGKRLRALLPAVKP